MPAWIVSAMVGLFDFFRTLPAHIADAADSRFGHAAGIILGTAALLILINTIVIPARERRADRRAARRNR